MCIFTEMVPLEIFSILSKNVFQQDFNIPDVCSMQYAHPPPNPHKIGYYLIFYTSNTNKKIGNLLVWNFAPFYTF